VYASTRQEEVAATGWPQEQIDAFLEMQFEAQYSFYHDNYHDTEWDVIEVDGQPAGRLYVSRWPEQIRIVDIALVPEFRGRGVGTKLITELLEEGGASGRPVRIHVEVNNPALTLYGRLGFTPIGESGVYLELERRPEAEPAAEGGAPAS
jgi:ribosomal protein S18 acetylase RimI-like enzyme